MTTSTTKHLSTLERHKKTDLKRGSSSMGRWRLLRPGESSAAGVMRARREYLEQNESSFVKKRNEGDDQLRKLHDGGVVQSESQRWLVGKTTFQQPELYRNGMREFLKPDSRGWSCSCFWKMLDLLLKGIERLSQDPPSRQLK